MKNKYLKLFRLASVVLAAGFATSCSDDDNNGSSSDPTLGRKFHVGYSVGPANGNAQVYIQALGKDVLDASNPISFNGFGFQVPATRTAFVFSSDDGEYVYSLNYGGGAIEKYKSNGGQSYTKVAEANVQPFIGTANPRWTKLNDETAMLHNVTTEKLYDSAGNYIRTKATAWLTSIHLADMSIGTVTNFEIPYNEQEASQGIHIFRIDKPFIQNGKVFYGVGKQNYNPATDENETMVYTNAQLLVVDFPSLQNPTIISTNANGVIGATNGYRMALSHTDSFGDTYLPTTSSEQIHMLKVKNGAFDESYSFNISEALGHGAQCQGWFYAKDGIGYVPYVNTDLGGLGTNNWGVARVDIYNKTVVDLELPGNLWLQQYQSGVRIGDQFYMSIAPIGATGNIYAFDIYSTSPTGYTKGASIQSTGAENYHIGLY